MDQTPSNRVSAFLPSAVPSAVSVAVFGALLALVEPAFALDVTVPATSLPLRDDADPPLDPDKRRIRFRSSTKDEAAEHRIVVPVRNGGDDPTDAGANLVLESTGGSGEGVPTFYDEHPPSPLYTQRFERVDGISAATSAAIANEIRQADFVDANGYFLVSGQRNCHQCQSWAAAGLLGPDGTESTADSRPDSVDACRSPDVLRLGHADAGLVRALPSLERKDAYGVTVPSICAVKELPNGALASQ